MTTVYSLSSSRDGEVRYIGQTNNMGARRRQHLSYAKLRRCTPVHKWINREIEQGFEIVMAAVLENSTLHVDEIEVIARYRAQGYRLLNLTSGGEGTVGWQGNAGNKRPDLAERNRMQAGKPGHAITEETKAKISATNKGKKKPHLAERNRAGAGKTGHKHTPESRAKIGAANRGRTHTPEMKERMSATAKSQNRKLSPESIAKLREGHRKYFEKRCAA